MKCAVLVFGQYRELDIAVKSWKFKDVYECDYYVSTWDRTYTKPNKYDITYDMEVIPEMITNHLPNAVVSIKPEMNSTCTGSKMVSHWKECLNLMKNSLKTYDLVIMTRFDNFFNEIDWNTINPDLIYSFSCTIKEQFKNGRPTTLHDMFFIGKPEYIESLINRVGLNTTNNIHQYMSNIVNELNLPIDVLIDLEIALVRPNCRLLHPNDHNHYVIGSLHQSWGN
jgi:uncharacterized protein YifN (PemK superfamily)